MNDPQTPAEWRKAATMAEVWLDIDSARQYGLITGGPEVDVDRCLDIVTKARARGIVVTAADVNVATAEILKALS